MLSEKNVYLTQSVNRQSFLYLPREMDPFTPEEKATPFPINFVSLSGESTWLPEKVNTIGDLQKLIDLWETKFMKAVPRYETSRPYLLTSVVICIQTLVFNGWNTTLAYLFANKIPEGGWIIGLVKQDCWIPVLNTRPSTKLVKRFRDWTYALSTNTIENINQVDWQAVERRHQEEFAIDMKAKHVLELIENHDNAYKHHLIILTNILVNRELAKENLMGMKINFKRKSLYEFGLGFINEDVKHFLEDLSNYVQAVVHAKKIGNRDLF
jgi:hypothetical protein